MSGAGSVDSQILGPIFASPAMLEVFGDTARLQAMLDFEAALARAEAKVGLIPKTAAPKIAAACRAERFNIAAIGRAGALAASPAVPLVKQLTAAVGGSAGRYVHWGATSQDVIDTGLTLNIRAGLDLLIADLAGIADAAAGLARKHRRTPMAGRTLLQHALPITFGLKAAGWLGLAMRGRRRLMDHRSGSLALQFGGAAGTLASIGDKGIAVTEALARELGLAAPAMPWHTARDRIVDVAAAVAIAAGGAAKIAADVAFLMQTDIAEVFEPAAPGRGGSSTLPHKRNPVGSVAALAAFRQAEARLHVLVSSLVQEQERAVGAWQAEWGSIAELFVLAGGAIAEVRSLLEGLSVDAKRMRANLDRTDGLIFAEAAMMALAPKLGRDKAQVRIEAASKAAATSGRHLRDVLADEPDLVAAIGAKELGRLFNPANYLGSADAFVSRSLAEWQVEKRRRR